MQACHFKGPLPASSKQMANQACKQLRAKATQLVLINLMSPLPTLRYLCASANRKFPQASQQQQRNLAAGEESSQLAGSEHAAAAAEVLAVDAACRDSEQQCMYKSKGQARFFSFSSCTYLALRVLLEVGELEKLAFDYVTSARFDLETG